MPSPQPTQDDITPDKPKTPAPKATSPKPAAPKPTAAKVSTPKQPTPTGPRPIGSAARTSPNGALNRQIGIKPRTPASAPIRNRPPGKKAEPTLLSDFLLGRPSPSRQRRRSLDAVKAEMRESAINRIRAPGGVHDRVKQWQKASAAAAVVEEPDSPEDDIDEIVVVVEEGSVIEEHKLRVQSQNIRPGRRKSREISEEAAKIRSKSAPRKRVISDDHWVMNKKKTSPTKKEFKVAPRPIPKNFLKQTAVNPPLEKKIADWVKRTEADTEDRDGMEPLSRAKSTPQPEIRNASPKPKSTASRDEIIVEIEVEPKSKSSSRASTPRARKTPSNGSKEELDKLPKGRQTPKFEPSRTPGNDGIRVKPYGENGQWDDGIRIKPLVQRPRTAEVKRESSTSNPFFDGISVKPLNVRKAEKPTPATTVPPVTSSADRRKSERYLKPPKEVEKTDRGSHSDGELEDENAQTPTRSPSKRHHRKSHSPSQSTDDIPFGDSAFSSLDLPLGAEANTLNRPKPQRNPSHLVPNVLKRVYNEGKKIMQDTPEVPARGGVNQPPSIESWLNNTTDPFLDGKAAKEPSKDTNDEDEREANLNADRDNKGTGSKHRRVRKSSEQHEDNHDGVRRATKSPLDKREARTLGEPFELRKPPTPPAAGLRRSPATRAPSPLIRSARKTPFRDALFEAFRGESSVEGILDLDEYFDEEEDTHQNLRDPKSPGRELRAIPEDFPSRQSSRQSADRLDVPDLSRNASGRSRRKRRSGHSGDHRLSTIASTETFSTSSSAADLSSDLTKTTLTQATTRTGRSDSNVSRRKSNRSGLKRRLTKHSDLVSMLSLPDTAPPGRAKSIRSARSVRTARTSLENATLQDLMRELADDEVKYARELKTLVNGVIPVLLTSVLSKSESAIAAGLFNPNATDVKDSFLTKPIVDMGVALERLKNLHKRIPLDDADALTAWLHRAHRAYQDYTRVWRLGFQDVVVNLAPVSRSASTNESSVLDSVPRNAEGDVVNANGERVDVAFLLKRPLVRIKYLAKLSKGLDKLNHTELSAKAVSIFTDLQEIARRRVKEECARLEDLYANNTDATRARDPQNLAPVEDAHIDRNRQVCAKDFFALDFPHSNGQRIECRVELILRDNPIAENDSGDVLICAADITRESTDRYLLFPPISKDFISATAGDKPGQLVVMVRGRQGPAEWRESFHLEIAEPETAAEWIEMLGSNPTPDPVLTGVPDNTDTMSMLSMDPSEISNVDDPEDIELPIGARRRRSSRRTPTKERPRSSTFSPSYSPPEVASSSDRHRNSPSPRATTRRKESVDDITGVAQAGRKQSARHHTRTRSTPSSPLASEVLLSDDEPEEEIAEERESRSRSTTPGRTQRRPLTPSLDLPHIPKVRKTSSRSSIDSGTTEDTRPDSPDDFRDDFRDSREPYTPTRSPGYPEEEENAPAPPPPPAHRSMSPSGLKSSIIIEPPAPKGRSRRTSSPLKHEYQPSDESDASETSYTSEESETEDEESSSASSSDDDDLESADLTEIEPAASIYGRRVSPTASLYSLPNVTIAPSKSISRGPQRVPIVHRKTDELKTVEPKTFEPKTFELKTNDSETRKYIASVTSWSNSKGRWEDIHQGPCSIVVSAGLIQVFELPSSYSNPAGLSTIQESVVEGSEEKESDKRPLIAQVLTPVVTLRQSTSVDIEVHSPPTDESRAKCSSTIRYRCADNPSCVELYKSIHKARMENPIYKKLEEERRVNAYGGATYEAQVAPSKKSSFFFGRKKSYRASTRAPSVINSEQSSSPSMARISESFKRLTGSSFFNIAKSSIERGSGSSFYTSSSGLTPPRTPHPASLAGTSTSYGGVNHTSENLKIRLYYLETRSQWRDCGNARLTVTAPPPGMRQASTVDHGIERRILVTRKPLNLEKSDESTPVEVLLDVVLGANCFSMIGNKGVTCNVWEDVVGPNGEVGMVGAIGRVSGRTRKWCLQAGSAPEASWIYSLVAVGR
ncbi:glucan 4-alpha-glucosidase protein [Rutstroemia sp. NJR-2017a WRK4]|nr:glucan 4-alpha-glucosidase protein [Rutstroemia sp. NJR-2017a WRK4]